MYKNETSKQSWPLRGLPPILFVRMKYRSWVKVAQLFVISFLESNLTGAC